MTRIPVAIAAVAVTLCAAVTGCTTTTDPSEGTTPAMSSEHTTPAGPDLHGKPSLEAAQTQYRQLVTTMADAVAALTPGTTWTFDENSWVGCGGDLADTDAKQAYVSAVFSGPIPDPHWSAAALIVTDGAATLGATRTTTFKNDPGDHDIAVAGDDGVEVRLGTQVASTLTAKSDCRLSELDAHSTRSRPVN